MVLLVMLLVMLLVVLLMMFVSMAVAVARRNRLLGFFGFLGFLGCFGFLLIQVTISPEVNLQRIFLLLQFQMKTLGTLLAVILIIVLITIIPTVVFRQILGDIGFEEKGRFINMDTGADSNASKNVALSNRKLDVANIGRDG
jgi:O-antigen ligase